MSHTAWSSAWGCLCRTVRGWRRMCFQGNSHAYLKGALSFNGACCVTDAVSEHLEDFFEPPCPFLQAASWWQVCPPWLSCLTSQLLPSPVLSAVASPWMCPMCHLHLYTASTDGHFQPTLSLVFPFSTVTCCVWNVESYADSWSLKQFSHYAGSKWSCSWFEYLIIYIFWPLSTSLCLLNFWHFVLICCMSTSFALSKLLALINLDSHARVSILFSHVTHT